MHVQPLSNNSPLSNDAPSRSTAATTNAAGVPPLDRDPTVIPQLVPRTPLSMDSTSDTSCGKDNLGVAFVLPKYTANVITAALTASLNSITTCHLVAIVIIEEALDNNSMDGREGVSTKQRHPEYCGRYNCNGRFGELKTPVLLYYGVQGYSAMLYNTETTIGAVYIDSNMSLDWVQGITKAAIKAKKHVFCSHHPTSMIGSLLDYAHQQPHDGTYAIQYTNVLMYDIRVHRFVDSLLSSHHARLDTLQTLDLTVSELSITNDDRMIRPILWDMIFVSILFITYCHPPKQQHHLNNCQDQSPQRPWQVSGQKYTGSTAGTTTISFEVKCYVDGDDASGGEKQIQIRGRVQYNDNTLGGDDDSVVIETAMSSTPPRQLLSLKLASRRVVHWTDHVIAVIVAPMGMAQHQHRTTSYRIYDLVDDNGNENNDGAIERGESIDMPNGPSEQVLLWRNFHHVCRTCETAMDEVNNSKNCDPSHSSNATSTMIVDTQQRRLGHTTGRTFRIWDALQKSIDANGATVDV